MAVVSVVAIAAAAATHDDVATYLPRPGLLLHSVMVIRGCLEEPFSRPSRLVRREIDDATVIGD